MDFLRVLFTPGCWIQNEPYCREFDEHLNELMGKHKFTQIDRYTAKLGDMELWVANHPYASFTPNRGMKMRPKRSTILAAHKKLMIESFRAA